MREREASLAAKGLSFGSRLLVEWHGAVGIALRALNAVVAGALNDGVVSGKEYFL